MLHKALGRRAPGPLPDVAAPSDPLAVVARADVRRVLDEELDALPDKYRSPVVLCWLDGLTPNAEKLRGGCSDQYECR